ncbi:hypothetical protein ACHAW6_008205 [Cyclotella cf. meneghiniana]
MSSLFHRYDSSECLNCVRSMIPMSKPSSKNTTTTPKKYDTSSADRDSSAFTTRPMNGYPSRSRWAT